MYHPSLSAPLALCDDVSVGGDHVGAAEVAAARRLREEAPQVPVRQAVVRRDVVGMPVLRARRYVMKSGALQERGVDVEEPK